MTKCLFINASPKQGRNASGTLLARVRLLTGSRADTVHLRTRADAQTIVQRLPEYEAMVIAMPLYVDSVPSHVARFMEDVQAFVQHTPLRLRVYVISNSGFIEGVQNRTLMQVMESFCRHCGLQWCGGVGIGGGVMLSVIQWLLWPHLALMVVAGVVCGLWPGTGWAAGLLRYAIGYVVIYVVFLSGVYWHSVRLARAVAAGQQVSTGYTRSMVPTLLFFLMASIYFIIASLCQGGIFRRWLRRP